jgi:hypothetical protein
MHTSDVQHIMDDWQLKTKLKLEKAVYDRMIIRDVNNYIAIYEDGNLKTKGAYLNLNIVDCVIRLTS